MKEIIAEREAMLPDRGSPVSEEARESQVERIIYALETEVEKFYNHLGRLENKLEPVLRACYAESEKAGPQASEVLVPLAERLDILAEYLVSRNETLVDIIDRLEI